MSSNANRLDSYSSQNYYFGSFDSAELFNEIGLREYETASPSVKRDFTADGVRSMPLFYGGATFNELEKDIDTFIEPDLITSTIESFAGVLEKIDMGGSFEKDRLIATRNKQGIFDFGLASKGLFRPSEFYSDFMAKNHPKEFDSYGEIAGVIPPDFIQNHKQKDGKLVFWYDLKGEKIQVQQRQYGVTRALDENKDLATKVFGNMLILVKPNKHLRFASTYDKCYLMHKNEGGKAKSVDLYVIQGGLQSADTKGMLLKTMPVLLAAKILEEAGIRTRIYATRSYSAGDNSFMFTYPIKNYGEDMDWNKAALNIGDPRVFRWKTWKSIAGILHRDYPKKKWSTSNGGAGYGSTMNGGAMLNETFERYKGYIGAKALDGDSNKKAVDRTLMLIGNVENVSELQNADESRATEIILKEFYRIMDSVDFQFNKTNKVAERIFKRELENGKTKLDIKGYLNTTLRNAYSVPRAGDYAATQKEQDKIFGILDSKIDSLYDFYEQNNY